MRKVIIIHNNPLLPRINNALNIDLLKKIYHTEYWDLSHMYGSDEKFHNSLKLSNIKTFFNKEQLKQELKKQNKNNTVFIFLMDELWSRRALFSYIRRFRYYRIRINFYPKPSIFSLKNLNFLLSKYGILKVLEYQTTIAFYLYKKAFKIRAFERYFACSENTPRTDNINSLDYEIYQDIQKNDSNSANEKHIVFLDTFFPLHPEMNVYVKNAESVAKAYRNSMKRFFDYLEKRFDLPVIIAAHPSADYKDSDFGYRKIYKNRTGELIKVSKLVIAHYSTANVYAVLFDKPIVYVTTKDMKKVRNGLYKRMAIRASLLGKKSYNIDDIDFEEIDYNHIEDKIRNKYIYTQITSKETEANSNSEIILSKLKEIFKELKTKEHA